jgi:hypothetical protein
MNELVALASLQHQDGAFPSVMARPHGSIADRNGFTAALVVRALRHVPLEDWRTIRERALGFIEACRSPRVDGAFGFWPHDARPPWASSVPADVDDTALMLAELLRYGRVTVKEVRRTIAGVASAHRVPPSGAGERPPWIAAGSFYTWLSPAGHHPAHRAVNVVDCCVNANMAALIAMAGARTLPGFAEAIRTVVDGVAWAGEHGPRLSSLTPFYPSPFSLLEAIDHAVECGASGLEPAQRQLRRLTETQLDAAAGVCRGAYARAVWQCQAVEIARRIGAPQHHPACC